MFSLSTVRVFAILPTEVVGYHRQAGLQPRVLLARPSPIFAISGLYGRQHHSRRAAGIFTQLPTTKCGKPVGLRYMAVRHTHNGSVIIMLRLHFCEQL